MTALVWFGTLALWSAIVGCATTTDRPRPKPPSNRRAPRRRCPKDRHDFMPVASIRRECVQGCHIVKGHTVVCRRCGSAGQVWQEPETATPTFEVSPRGGVYR